MTQEELYKKYFQDNNLERAQLWELIAKEFEVQRAVYPGSFIHITPSFYISDMTYIDTDKQAKKFFSQPKGVLRMIDERKVYKQPAAFTFLPMNYASKLNLEQKSFDLMISQYAGIISQPCKKYLRKGGILLVEDSFGDAGIANQDKDYELIGVVLLSEDQYCISYKNLDKYFKMKSGKTYTTEELVARGKGVKYAYTASNYLFRLKV